VKDKGTGAENLIWLASRQSGRAHPSSLAADDILAALTGRIAELEARVFAILAEVEPEPPRVDSGSGRALSASKADAGRGADKMSREARVEADDELTRASEERRMLATEMRLLREAFQDARGQPFAGPEASPVEAQIAPELRAAIADEMRSLLTELLADFRSRGAAPPPPAEHISVTTEIAASVVPEAPEPILEQIVEDVKTASPPADLFTEAAPIETFESIVEDVDELVRPTTKPFVNDYVEELREPEPLASADVFPAEAAPAEPAAGIVEEYVEEFLRTESPPSEPIDLEAALPEAAPPVVDEPVFGPAEPAAPITGEYIEEVRRADPTPTGTIELSAAPAEPIEPIIDKYVEELRPPESLPSFDALEPTAAPIEPFEAIVPEYVEEIETPITPPVIPSTPDPRIAALWDNASLPTEAEAVPLSQVEPASFITEESVAETHPIEIPEAPPEPLPEFAPEQTSEFAPPPVEFAPPPPVEYTPEPPVISEPAPVAYSPPTEANTPSWASPFPELRVADDRGLHQIQIVISPIHSFPRLLDTEARIRALSTVNAVHLRDFRNGIATFAVAVSEAISPAEFGAVIQMLDDLHLRLEGTTQTGVELRAEDDPGAS
jgi:hypothetical protein